MEELEFWPHVLVRTASRSFEGFNYNQLPQALLKADFQAAIFFASEVLFNELKKVGFDFNKMSDKQKFSLAKYYNRSTYRSTPFGMFAGVGNTEWASFDPTSLQVRSTSVLISPGLLNNQQLEMLNSRSGNAELTLKRNNTLYRVGNDYRFLQVSEQPDKAPVYQINTLKATAFVTDITQFCKVYRRRAEIMAYCQRFSEAPGVLIDEMVERGLLTAHNPTHSPGDYLRLWNKVSVLERLPGTDARKVKEISARSYDPNVVPVSDIEELKKEYPGILKQKWYVNTNTELAGGLDYGFQTSLADGLYAISKLLSPATDSMRDFKEKFKGRFGEQEIPLLKALDPDAGISYQNLDNNYEDNLLLENISFHSEQRPVDIQWSKAHQLLMNKMAVADPYAELVITEADLDSISTESKINYPPSFSILFTEANGRVCLERAGGHSAVALLARFAASNPTLADEIQRLTNFEQEVNKEVVFGEIICGVEPQVADVTTRPHTYRYQIPILDTASLESEFQLPLNDLYISVVQDTIVLRSEKLNRVVVPRFSSAYNHTRHDLAHFRFLCDLQAQSLQTNLNLDLANLFPNLKFYPRVVFKNCIISKATWILDNIAREEIVEAFNVMARARQVLADLSIPRYFTLTRGDHSLFFDQASDSSMSVFLNCIRQEQKEVILKETFVSGTKAVTNSEGKPLASEFIASVINTIPSYKSIVLKKGKSNRRLKRLYLPGQEWIFYKIYCSVYAANTILGGYLYRQIERLLLAGHIDQWFFIRYYDTDHHIRLRMRSPTGNAGFLLNEMKALLMFMQKEGLISNVIVAPYERELERYGHAQLEAELAFQASSGFAIKYFRKVYLDRTPFNVLLIVLASVDAMIETAYVALDQKSLFTQQVFESFSLEFFVDGTMKKELDQKYRKLRPQIEMAMDDMQRKKMLRELNFDQKELQGSARNDLLLDIIHLHMNRLFNQNQRRQEMVVYFLLTKYYRSMMARSARSTAGK